MYFGQRDIRGCLPELLVNRRRDCKEGCSEVFAVSPRGVENSNVKGSKFLNFMERLFLGMLWRNIQLQHFLRYSNRLKFRWPKFVNYIHWGESLGELLHHHYQ